MTSTESAKRNRHYEAGVTHKMHVGSVFFILKKWKHQSSKPHIQALESFGLFTFIHFQFVSTS